MIPILILLFQLTTSPKVTPIETFCFNCSTEQLSKLLPAGFKVEKGAKLKMQFAPEKISHRGHRGHGEMLGTLIVFTIDDPNVCPPITKEIFRSKKLMTMEAAVREYLVREER